MNSSVIARIREGMTVVDASGSDIGTVELVCRADLAASRKLREQEPDPDDVARVPGPTEMPIGPPVGMIGMMGAMPGGGVTPAGSTMAHPPTGRGEPELPPALAERLLESGYVKVDTKGLFRRDVYVGADDIASVSGDVISLSVDRSALAKEGH